MTRLDSMRMAGSRIHYTSTQTSNSLELDKGTTEINLSGGDIISLDLRGLENSPELKEINLSNNRLQSIDLSHLAKCPSLEKLNLFRNSLRYIDISSLSKCPNLQELYLNLNQLSLLDLSSLTNCPHLTKLYLGSNHIREIDLYPLKGCKELEWLSLARNQLRHVDITPLLFSQRLETLTVDDGVILDSLFLPEMTRLSWGIEENRSAVIEVALPEFIQKHGWPDASSLIASISCTITPLQQREFQNSILHRLGFFDFDVLDFDLISVLELLPETTTCEGLEETVRQNAYRALSDQIRDEGPSHFINIEAVRSNPDLAVLAPAILELRKREISGIVIEEINGVFDLRPLWMTSYGFELLSALSLGLDTDRQGMDQVILHASQTGFELNTRVCESADREDDYTDSISQYILKRAEMT